MSESEQSAPKKKISLQEAIKKQLESKKNQGDSGKSTINSSQTTKKMKSQQTKKANNQRRRTGV
ncbi:hypothetical protein SAMN05443252_102139 [Bacillus sp. OV322]|uniref:hypothetical protein n=1 Tax=Bacillus sp. OV322 TaxID=1882764 RepID=UPI0008DEF4E3|nr:hypothetical protein [Bacillus sp. OV322]SFC19457.1 hypothetical protein SAMN05443252_102139 [Bacillus sp. OV322]